MKIVAIDASPGRGVISLSVEEAARSAETAGATVERVRLAALRVHSCTGCGWCVAACELHLLTLERMRWDKIAALHEPQRCTGCSQCAMRCPFGVIDMRMQAVEVTINAA